MLIFGRTLRVRATITFSLSLSLSPSLPLSFPLFLSLLYVRITNPQCNNSTMRADGMAACCPRDCGTTHCECPIEGKVGPQDPLLKTPQQKRTAARRKRCCSKWILRQERFCSSGHRPPCLAGQYSPIPSRRVFLIGLPKSGTSSLTETLRRWKNYLGG